MQSPRDAGGRFSRGLIFRVDGREYEGETACEIVAALGCDVLGARGRDFILRDFLRRPYARLADRITLRELDVADALGEEALALSHLYLRDEFGAGELAGVPPRKRRAHPL